MALYVTSEDGERGGGGRGGEMTTLELPKVTSVPIPLDEFAAYMEEKRINGCRGLRDQFLVREKGGREGEGKEEREREREREREGEGETETEVRVLIIVTYRINTDLKLLCC